ncbi:MAG: aspartate 1-decarboxylase [Gammaproteobacteria bacterium]
MQLTMLKSKLHRACVTHAVIFIQVHQRRLESFRLLFFQGRIGSRIISVNGAAAHKANPDDRIIICTYTTLEEQEAKAFKPSLVYLDENNRVTGTGEKIAVQAA